MELYYKWFLWILSFVPTELNREDVAFSDTFENISMDIYFLCDTYGKFFFIIEF